MTNSINNFVDELQALCNKHRVHLEGGIDFSIDIVVLEPSDGNVEFEANYPHIPEHDLYPRLTYNLESYCHYEDNDE